MSLKIKLQVYQLVLVILAKSTPLYLSLSLPNASKAFSSLMAWQFKSVNNRIKNKKCHSTSVIIIVTSFHPPFAWKNSPFKREKIRHLSVKKFPGCSKPGMSNGPHCHLKYLNGPQNLLKLESSILTRAKRATNRNNVAKEKRS